MKNGYFVEEGDLNIERVLCGDVKVGDAPLLQWRNRPNVACPRTEHARHADQSLLWFLERDASGALTANTSQRAKPLDELEAYLDTLAVYPFHVITPIYDQGDRVIVTIEFHNATTTPITVPTVKVGDDGVTCSRGLSIAFHPRHYSGGSTPAVVRPDSWKEDEKLARTTLAPGQSVRATLSVSNLLGDMQPGIYWFDVRVDGRPSRHAVRVRSAWETGFERVRDTPAEIPYYIRSIRAGGPGAQGSIMSLQLRAREVSPFAGELMALSDSLDAPSRGQLISLLGHLDIAPDVLMDYFEDRLDDPTPEVRAAAASCVGRLLRDPKMQHRRDHTTALLMSMLDDENPQVRLFTVASLSSSNAIIALPSLRILAGYDDDRQVRKEAQRAVELLERNSMLTGH